MVVGDTGSGGRGGSEMHVLQQQTRTDLASVAALSRERQSRLESSASLAWTTVTISLFKSLKN